VEEPVPSAKDNPAAKQPNQVVGAVERLPEVCIQQQETAIPICHVNMAYEE
jgi:hypothetical protein